MPMMNVRIVRVIVLDRFVYVSVGMGLLTIPVGVVLVLVLVLVMYAMDVRVFVIQGQMTMHARVIFREMQPHACAHG